MNQDFHVPYNQIKYFTLKDGGSYRHTLSYRIYLYLCHLHSGRIKWEDRKELVNTFKSSHTAVQKALKHLEKIDFITIHKNWITTKGHDKINDIVKDKIGRNFNIEFNFTLDILLDRLKFSNHLFLSLFQSSAMLRGKKKKLIPQAKINSDSVMLKGGLENEDSLGSSVIEKIGFIQKQSSTYLAKMTDRHEITMFNRNKKISAENHYLLNENPLREKAKGHRTALTVNGFNTKEYSQLIVFREWSDANNHLKQLIEKTPSYKSCFVMEANHGGYVIAKYIPDEYLFAIETKRIMKNRNYDFSSFQISP